ncbi:CD69 protein, partial [Dasyornis broadbenti]|nr:CD69 protein [Dasyornis broadbenti]
CPDGWVRYWRICYFLSRDHCSWDQAQAGCCELGASLAVLKDEEMEFLICFSENNDHWLGLHNQDQELQQGDSSSFNSSIPLLGNAQCVYPGNGAFRSMSCSKQLPFICSRPQ